MVKERESERVVKLLTAYIYIYTYMYEQRHTQTHTTRAYMYARTHMCVPHYDVLFHESWH